MKLLYKNLTILTLLIIVGCKKTEAKSDLIKDTKKEIKNTDVVSLDQIKQFDEKDGGKEFTTDNFVLKYNNLDNKFSIIMKSRVLGNIDFEGKNFDGPGYNVYLYENPNTKFKVIIFEALADIGTAWYYPVILKENEISNKFFIEEPRSNSDEVSLNKFLSIDIDKSECVFKFNKKYIAKYSLIPKELESNQQYIYFKTDISNNKMNVHSVGDVVMEKGMYSIQTKTESVATGESIMLKFNYYFFDNKRANLRISTSNSEDAYCEGKYKLITENNQIKGTYDDQGICTSDLNESNFYIKKENNKYFIRSTRFINQDWQELKKE